MNTTGTVSSKTAVPDAGGETTSITREKFCANCGHKYPDMGDNFCGECGTKRRNYM